MIASLKSQTKTIHYKDRECYNNRLIIFTRISFYCFILLNIYSHLVIYEKKCEVSGQVFTVVIRNQMSIGRWSLSEKDTEI